MRPWRITTALLGIGLLCAPAFVAGQAAYPGQPSYTNPDNGPNHDIMPSPGMVNYVEGAVYLDGKPLGKNSVGNTEMAAGQVLQTHNGKAEILLNPGIYLRVGEHSAVKMISPNLTPSKIEVVRGKIGVEVDQLLKQNVIQVVENGVTTQLVKTGYYEFNANDNRVEAFSGEARVEYKPGKWAKVKARHEMTLQPGAKENAAKFQPDPQEDALMQWSKLRSQYLAQANEQMAPRYYGSGFYPGWYWDPYMWNYTFIGGGPFRSPFGWGYYPFGWGWGGMGGWGGWGGFYTPGFYTPGVYGHRFYRGRDFDGDRDDLRSHDFHGNEGSHAGGGFHGGQRFHAGNGFHSGGGR